MSASTTLARASLGTLFKLGRVSNLPTVWTNVLAATVIAGAEPVSVRTGLALVAMTLFYVGGMYLNDAFDNAIDARERPSRPIPAGLISARTVFSAGYAMLAGAVALMALASLAAAAAGLALAACIIGYDVRHKGNPLSPALMGVCRMLVYAGTAAIVAGAVSGAVVVAGGAVLAHTAGLTYAAKQEGLDRIDRLWPLAFLALP